MRLIFHEMRVLTRGQGGPVLWLSPGPRLLLFYKHCNTGWPHTIWNFCYPRVIFQAIFQTQTKSCSPMDGAPTNYSTNNALKYSTMWDLDTFLANFQLMFLASLSLFWTILGHPKEFRLRMIQKFGILSGQNFPDLNTIWPQFCKITTLCTLYRSIRRLNWEPSHPALPFVTLISVSTWAVPLSMMLFTLCLLRLISGFFWFIFQPQFVWIFTLFHFYKFRHNCFLFFPSKNWDLFVNIDRSKIAPDPKLEIKLRLFKI